MCLNMELLKTFKKFLGAESELVMNVKQTQWAVKLDINLNDYHNRPAMLERMK